MVGLNHKKDQLWRRKDSRKYLNLIAIEDLNCGRESRVKITNCGLKGVTKYLKLEWLLKYYSYTGEDVDVT